VARIVRPEGKASTNFTFDDECTPFIVPDGENLTDLLNRAYWLGVQKTMRAVDVELENIAREENLREI